MHEHQNSKRLVAVLITVVMVIVGLTALGSPAYAADVGYKGPFYGRADGTTGGHVPGAPTAQKPQSKLWFAHGSWWGALWNETSTNTGEAFTIHRYDWGANSWIDTGVKLETRSRSDLDVLWDGRSLYVASNTAAPTIDIQKVTVSRFGFDGTSWSAEWTTQVADSFTYSPVIEKDSTGTLWMTYTEGTSVMITHSLPGAEQSWVDPYVLPTPNGESSVSHDTTNDPSQASSDIASIVSFDADKIGVLWSNQVTDTVYWASHQDGAPDREWSTEVAFAAPEGADDHISLKSVTGTDGGRVYAVTKTSMNGSDPILEVLVMRLDGSWDSFPYASADTNLTRPIILLHPARKELYVFAAAGERANSGGSIYYKKTSMTSPDFGSMDERGTLFIADSALSPDDDTERINNPSSTKQNLNSTTGLLVLANNDPTDYYYYNRMSLSDPPPDTTAPETTITGEPAASTTATTAEFSFTSSEPGSTFECKLDDGAFSSCISPKSYTGLSVGSHSFAVRAKDAAGNTDATPATSTWTVAALDTAAPETTITGEPAASTTETTAEFSFTSSEPGSTFECKLDDGAFASCISPKGYTGLTAAEHTFEVRATDAAGNIDATPASSTWTVDITAPETTITAQPAASTTETTAGFSFTSSEPGSTFECKLDDGVFSSCVSPKSYTGLTAAEHTFVVRATDAAGNTDATPATRTWTVTAPAPTSGGTGGGGGGGSTPPPDDGGSTPPPDDGGSTPPPDDGGSTPPPSTPERDDAALFADDFSSGFADGWRSFTRSDGTVAVQSGAVRAGDVGARLRTSNVKGSAAVLSARVARGRALEIRWSALITRDARAGKSRLIRIRDTSGRVVLTVLRRAATDRLLVRDRSGTTVAGSRMPTGSVSSLALVLRQRAGRDAWSLSVNGRVLSTRTARTGDLSLRTIAFGTGGGKRLNYRIDDVTVVRP